MDIEPALFVVAGVDNMTCVADSISPRYAPGPDLRVFLCSEGAKTWGAFDWVPYSGVLLMDPGPTSLSTHTPVSFG